MKKLVVSKINKTQRDIFPDLDVVHQIDCNPWNFYTDLSASFGIGYDHNHLYLEYHVREPHVRGMFTKHHDTVFQESCVECFISLDHVHYYNLEFNCIGTILSGYGKDRFDRIPIDAALLSGIKTKSSLGNNPIEISSRTSWNLRIAIGLEVFQYTAISSLENLEVRGNFFKCGDLLKHPHYLAWNYVAADKPDFHQSEYFGHIIFR